jgi:hypothetical protein
MPGFKTAVLEAIKVDTTAVARIDLKLAPQDSKVAVEVSARASALETETSSPVRLTETWVTHRGLSIGCAPPGSRV